MLSSIPLRLNSGASSPVAGLLATASKAMGFVALMRILITVTMPDSGEAFWFTAIAIIAVVTMTWGNLAALTSTNPKRILAYSSVSHAGYMLAGLAAIGSGLASEEAMKLVLTAIVFHLAVLVVFKFGAFLVLSLLETEGRSHELEDLHGLARREPLIAGSISKSPMWKKFGNYTPNNRNASTIDRLGFYVPNHQGMTTRDVDKISDIILKY